MRLSELRCRAGFACGGDGVKVQFGSRWINSDHGGLKKRKQALGTGLRRFLQAIIVEMFRKVVGGVEDRHVFLKQISELIKHKENLELFWQVHASYCSQPT